MSDFVDYNKRSVSLPEGCKDLTDVLEQTRSGLASGDLPLLNVGGRTVRGGTEIGGLADTANYVGKVFGGKAEQQFLMIFLEREHLTINIFRAAEAGLKASIWFPDDESTVRTMRSFFERWGLKVPPEGSLLLMLSGAKLQRTWDIFPVPLTPTQLTDILHSLLKQFERVDENLSIKFAFYEVV